MSEALRRPMTRATLVVALLSAAAFALLVASPVVSGTSAPALEGLVPNLAAQLGLTGGIIWKIWDAVFSWYTAALSILLVPLGFGAWAVTVRLTAQSLVRTLGEKAARAAFKAF